MTARIESLLAARLFMSPQRVGRRLYFISNLSGRMSLYAMDFGGSVPEPLLPPSIAMQNPKLLMGHAFYVLPALNQILVMLDRDGDENYQPMLVPLEGGDPQLAFGAELADFRVQLRKCSPQRNRAYFAAESRKEGVITAFQADLANLSLQALGSSPWGSWPLGVNAQDSKVILIDRYSMGDHVLYLWERGATSRQLLFGQPLDERSPGDEVRLNSILDCHFTEGDGGLLFRTSLFEDTYGPGYFPLDNPGSIRPVLVSGQIHSGAGELYELDHLSGQRYLLSYNIDGCSWGYEGEFDEGRLELKLDRCIWGQGQLSDGVVQHQHYDRDADGYALAFSTATSPAQIYTIDGEARDQIVAHTRERVLGVPVELLSSGEEASYQSFDGLRVSARLYLPSQGRGFQPPHPLVYYLHGGPQSQERPDFTWFSMPLIQYLTLLGFAVFVPNVRGSTGYGLAYAKRVDRDWGGQDRLDHVHAMQLLAADPRLDTRRTGLVGRSYGGYMSLTLAGRHPELWAAAVDMFGPYDLISFSQRIPPTWKPYYRVAIGDPQDEQDRQRLKEQSPKTHLGRLACPLLVIQGANDPRVVAQESTELVEDLRAQGKPVEWLLFENEGHDVLKYENRVECYNAIAQFFQAHLSP